MIRPATLNGKDAVLPADTDSNEANEAAPASLDSREILIGKLVEVIDDGAVLVEFPSAGQRCCGRALATVPLAAADIGRSVAVAFVAGNPERPIVLGLIAETGTHTNEERLTITAEREIVLRCGKASLTLTRAGKILLRGAYLLSRSSGVNRIKGASVQIN